MVKNPKSLKNLQMFDSNQSREQAKKNGSKGGRASQEARRKRKTQKEQLEMLLSLPLKSDKAKAQIQALGIDASEVDNQMAMNVAMYNLILKGGKGAVQAYNSFVDLLGDRDSEKKDLEIKRLREEVNKLQLEQEKLKRDLNMGENNFEDLTPLKDLLKGD